MGGVTNQISTHLRERPSTNLADHPTPKGREEIWRFTPLDRFAPLFDDAASWRQLPMQVAAVDGVAVNDNASFDAIPVDRPSAIAWNRADGATLLRVGGDVAEPITVNIQGAGGSQVGQLVIDAAPGSRAVVVLEHTGLANYIGNVETRLGDGADITVVSLQEWADEARHAGWHQALVGRDAHYRHVAVTIGGSVVRLQSNVSYSGEGGSAELFGLHMTDASQHHEHRIFVDQNQPKTTSRVDYRGALQGKGAHSVWIGDVLIRHGADGIDSYESNRNLLLTDGCVADSVPNLEIETGNIVGAGHSTATGHFDDEQLFYLRSRGIPEVTARRLVVQGFLGDIIRHIGIQVIEDRLMAVVDDELDRASQMKEN